MSSSREPTTLAASDSPRRGDQRPSDGRAGAGRRNFLTRLAAAAGSAVLAACGFHLRGDVAYPFATATINAPTAPQFGLELRRMLETGGATRIVDSAQQAQVIIDITTVVDDKGVLSLSSGGRVREYVLTKRVVFSVHDTTGRDWLLPSELTIRRSFTFNESEVLAREAQEQRLLKEMQTDAVQQILRRLQAAKKPS